MNDAAAVPSPAKRLLILARDRDDLHLLPANLEVCRPPVRAHATRRVGEALALLARESFDAAVCPVDEPRDVGSLIRLRKAAPRTPVLGLLTRRLPELVTLSLQMGAAAVLERAEGAAATSTVLHRALETKDLVRQTRDGSRTARRLASEIRALSARARVLAAEARSTCARHPAEGFEPLLVEDNPSEAFLFCQALRKAGLPRRLPVARTAREAIDYLSGRGEFSDRVANPVPSIVILDYHLGGETGEEVLRFIRTDPALHDLPVVLFTSTSNPSDLARMRELGISAHIVKPSSFAELRTAMDLILNVWRAWRGPSADPARAVPAAAVGG
jgi:CheY-like chemotaxis protein